MAVRTSEDLKSLLISSEATKVQTVAYANTGKGINLISFSGGENRVPQGGNWENAAPITFTPGKRDYIGVLSDSDLVKGRIVSQNAGSSNSDIYYRIGGGGVNRRFSRALGATLRADVNKALIADYDERFGKTPRGARQKDKEGGTVRLTSFYVPLPADAHDTAVSVGKRVAGLVYSVGPDLDGPSPKFPDPELYRRIYVEAFSEVARANRAGEFSSPAPGEATAEARTGASKRPPPDPNRISGTSDVRPFNPRASPARRHSLHEPAARAYRLLGLDRVIPTTLSTDTCPRLETKQRDPRPAARGQSAPAKTTSLIVRSGSGLVSRISYSRIISRE